MLAEHLEATKAAQWVGVPPARSGAHWFFKGAVQREWAGPHYL